MHQKQVRVEGVGAIDWGPLIESVHRQNERGYNQHKQVHRIDPCKPGHPELDSPTWTNSVCKVFPVDVGQNESRQDKKYIYSEASRLEEKCQATVGIGEIPVSNVKQQD
ncbi:hypothetical protein D3C76_1129010 [compost metagenome]